MDTILCEFTLERCRSGKGVPQAWVPAASYLLDVDEAVTGVLDGAIGMLQTAAEQAHPDAPHMQMPSLDPADYQLTLPDGTPVPDGRFPAWDGRRARDLKPDQQALLSLSTVTPDTPIHSAVLVFRDG